jgi:hypothetical protein
MIPDAVRAVNPCTFGPGARDDASRPRAFLVLCRGRSARLSHCGDTLSSGAGTAARPAKPAVATGPLAGGRAAGCAACRRIQNPALSLRPMGARTAGAPPSRPGQTASVRRRPIVAASATHSSRGSSGAQTAGIHASEQPQSRLSCRRPGYRHRTDAVAPTAVLQRSQGTTIRRLPDRRPRFRDSHGNR